MGDFPTYPAWRLGFSIKFHRCSPVGADKPKSDSSDDDYSEGDSDETYIVKEDILEIDRREKERRELSRTKTIDYTTRLLANYQDKREKETSQPLGEKLAQAQELEKYLGGEEFNGRERLRYTQELEKLRLE